MSFDQALAFVLQREGGLSNRPDDPGGLTFRGITQATYNTFRERQGKAPSSVERITEGELRLIYLEFWTAAKCAELPDRLATCVFDAAVNMGPAQAIRLLQRALWIADDGYAGPETIAKARASDELRTAFAMLTLRREYYAALSRRKDSAGRLVAPVFLRGWLARVGLLWNLTESSEESKSV